MILTLYSYFRSSTAYRTRIALNWKGLPYTQVPVHLLRDGGEQHRPDYAALNPQRRVPTLVVEQEGRREVLIQSPAILEWLEEVVPHPPLLPADPVARAQCRAIAAVIGCDIHPLDNLSTLNYLRQLGHDKATVDAWYAHWLVEGFRTVEALMGDGPYACGADPTLADVYLVPQVYNARRYAIALDAFPRIVAATAAAEALEPFAAAAPARQPDAA